MSSLRAIVVFPLDLLLSYRRTSSSHLSCPAGKSCSLHRSGTKTCRKRALVGFPPRRGAQRRTNRLDASRRDGAAPRSTSKLSLFCQRQKCNMNLFALLLKIFNCFCTHRSKLSIKCFVRDDVVLIFHAFDHWPESWAISSNQKPRRLPEPLSERWRFSFERWKFTKAIDVDKLCRSFDRGFALKNHCLNCLSNRSRNLRQPGEPACLNCRFSAVNLEILWFKSMLLSLQRVHHLTKLFDCRHLARYRWSRELQLFQFVSQWKILRTQENVLWVVSTPSSANTNLSPISHPGAIQNTSVSPNNLGLRTKVLRYHDVFFMTHRHDPWVKTAVAVLYVTVQRNWSWKMWNLMDTTVDSERTVKTTELCTKNADWNNWETSSWPRRIKKIEKNLMHWLI